MSEKLPHSLEFNTKPPHSSSVDKFIKKTEQFISSPQYAKEKFRIGEGIERSTGVIMVEKNPRTKYARTIFRVREDMPIFDKENREFIYPFKQITIVKNKAENEVTVEIGNEVILPYYLGLQSSSIMVDSNMRLEGSTKAHRFFRTQASTDDLQEMYTLLSAIDESKRLNRFGKTAEEEKKEASEVIQIRNLAKGLLRIAGDKSIDNKKQHVAVFADPDTFDVIRIEGDKGSFRHRDKGISIEYQSAGKNMDEDKHPSQATYVLREDNAFLYHDENKKITDGDFYYSKLSSKERLSAELLNPGRTTNHRAVSDKDREGILQKLIELRQYIDSYPMHQEVFNKRKKLG